MIIDVMCMGSNSSELLRTECLDTRPGLICYPPEVLWYLNLYDFTRGNYLLNLLNFTFFPYVIITFFLCF